jgi:hypothetical protein
MCFMPVTDPKTVKNRVHLDLTSTAMRRLEASEPSYLRNKSRDRTGGVSNEVDDGIKADVRRGDLVRPPVQPDVQLLVEIWVIAEPYEGFAADWLTRLELRDPGCRRDREGSRGALFDLGEFGLFDAIAHDCILA